MQSLVIQAGLSWLSGPSDDCSGRIQRSLLVSSLCREREIRTQRAGGMCPMCYHKVSFHVTSSSGQFPLIPTWTVDVSDGVPDAVSQFLSPFFIIVRFPTSPPSILTLCWGHKAPLSPAVTESPLCTAGAISCKASATYTHSH